MSEANPAVQAAIMVLSLSAAYFASGRTKRSRRWAGAFGLASQPFWLLSAWAAGQWGVVVLALFYAFAWTRMIYNNRKDAP